MYSSLPTSDAPENGRQIQVYVHFFEFYLQKKTKKKHHHQIIAANYSEHLSFDSHAGLTQHMHSLTLKSVLCDFALN